MVGSNYIFLLILIAGACSERNFKFYMDKCAIEYADPNTIETFTSCVVQRNNRSFVSAELITRHSISQLDVKMVVDLISSQNKRVRLINVYVDVCSFFSNKHKSYLYNIITKTLNRHVSPEIKCPIKANSSYTVDNLFVNENDFPVYVPVSRFEGTLDFQSQKKLFARLLFYGGVNHI